MPLNREQIIQRELNYFKGPMAKEPAFIRGEYDEEYNGYDEDRCVYKTSEDRKCAVGVLLKPTLYEERFDEADGLGVLGLPEAVQEYLGKENLEWLTKLQMCHDQCAKSWISDRDDGYTENPHFGRYFLEVAKEANLLA
ncbi:MAG: hypothetical protein ACHQ1D_01185 [Nitrososphaerales archaeon]